MNTMFKKFATGTAALALMTTVFASGALAADSTTTTGVVGGTLDLTNVETVSFTDPTTNANVILNGTVQQVTSSLSGIIKDSTGSGAGWHVNVKASPFVQKDGAGVITRELTESILTLDKLTSAQVTVGTGSDAFETLVALGGPINTANGVKMLSAAKDGGMGTYEVKSVPMTLTLNPKEVYAGNYTSTTTVTLTTGP